MARVVYDDGRVFHKSARGTNTACDAGTGARHPRPGEVERRRLFPCRDCYQPSSSRKKPKARSEEREAGHLDRMDQLRPMVLARAGYRCERCGEQGRPRRPLECHHRLMRSQGGPDRAENLVVLCRGCHQHVHAHPAYGYETGLLIRHAYGPPAEPWEPPPDHDLGLKT